VAQAQALQARVGSHSGQRLNLRSRQPYDLRQRTAAFCNVPTTRSCWRLRIAREIEVAGRGTKNALPDEGIMQGPHWSKAVEVRSYVTPRTGSDGIQRFRGLSLVKCDGPQRSYNHARSGGQIFSAAEMRHNFAIWPLRKATPRQHRHLYYCVRCKWAFSVDLWGAVTPVDSNGQPILGHEAADRLATFSQGPCPVFRRLTRDPHATRKVAPIVTFPARLAALILTVSKAWKSSVRGRRDRPRSLKENPNHRSKRG